MKKQQSLRVVLWRSAQGSCHVPLCVCVCVCHVACSFITTFVTLFAVVIAVTKDLPDVEGDIANNIQTFATRLGVSSVSLGGEYDKSYTITRYSFLGRLYCCART